MPIKVTKDGRTIRTGREYTLFRSGIYRLQGGMCCVCPRLTSLAADLVADNSFHIAHCGTRGLGGSVRDDVIGKKKGQVEGGKCGACHRREHNQS